jgi:hypothetical protein
MNPFSAYVSCLDNAVTLALVLGIRSGGVTARGELCPC